MKKIKKIDEFEFKWTIEKLFWEHLDARFDNFDDIDFGETFGFLGGSEKDFLKIIEMVGKKYKLDLETQKNLIDQPMFLIIDNIWNKFTHITNHKTLNISIN